MWQKSPILRRIMTSIRQGFNRILLRTSSFVTRWNQRMSSRRQKQSILNASSLNNSSYRSVHVSTAYSIMLNTYVCRTLSLVFIDERSAKSLKSAVWCKTKGRTESLRSDKSSLVIGVILAILNKETLAMTSIKAATERIIEKIWFLRVTSNLWSRASNNISLF